MTVYTHEEFMEKIGKKKLQAKGYTVKDNLIDYSVPKKKPKKDPKPDPKKGKK